MHNAIIAMWLIQTTSVVVLIDKPMPKFVIFIFYGDWVH